MRSSETRYVNQCTYTPSGGARTSFKSATPFIKLAILSSALSDRQSGDLVLKRLITSQDADATTRHIGNAVQRAWMGEIASAAAALSDISIDDVARFAKRTIDAELSVVKTAARAVEKVIDRLAASHDGGAPAGTGSAADAPVGFASSKAWIKAASGANVALAEALRAATTAESGRVLRPVLLDRLAIQAELSRSDREAATALGAFRFFELARHVPPTAQHEQTHVSSFLSVREHLRRQKHLMVDALVAQARVDPVGFLHLERLQFTPLGYVRGELVYSLPLLPRESVRLSHREWSKTDTEYAELVATSIETATEDSLSEKSEITESFGTEQGRNSAINSSVTASGSYGKMNIATSAGYSAEASESQSRECTAKRAQEVTRTASARSKQEHKITFSVSTEYGREEEQVREITNSSDRPVRWDFYRLMQEWQIDLYRYDIRLTYDVVVPEPGSYLLRKYVLLRELNEALAQPNPFSLSPEGITRDNWTELAAQYGTSLDAPPAEFWPSSAYDQQVYHGRVIGNGHVEVSLPEDYQFDWWYAEGSAFRGSRSQASRGKIDTMVDLNTYILNAGAKAGNKYLWRYLYDLSEEEEPERGTNFEITVWVRGRLRESAFQQWQARCYERLSVAAAAQYESRRLRLTQQRDELKAELSRDDALTLRKVEKEELMKAILRWVLGSNFSFYPSDLPNLTMNHNGDLEYYDPSHQNVQRQYYEPMLKHGDVIRFVHHAIEWENVNYVLYPYFWTDDYRWDLKQSLYHPDFVHRNFLRAGAARVVMTIRPGYEKAFLSFVESSSLAKQLPADHPYMTLADELKAYAETTYPYTPNPNEEREENRVGGWKEYTPTGAMDVVEGGVLTEGGAGGTP